jgi:cysteine desulfurase / selenocysteine lyase
MIYLDHAATSWPKPPQVMAAMTATMQNAGGNPGRSGHRLAMRAADIIYQTRENIARLFAIADPLRISFTSGATEALNVAIKGLLKPGDHAVYSGIEHNAVWRPLKKMETLGVTLGMAAAQPDGRVRLADIIAEIRPETRLIVIAHASNVNGALNDIGEIGRSARMRHIPVLVDASQTAGVVPIDVEAMQIAMLAFPGHKGLLGPQGVGGLFVHSDIILESLKEGGTGSASESPRQPDILPDRLESGTPNTPGIAGLNEGVKLLLSRGVETIRQREDILVQRLLNGLIEIPSVRIYGPGSSSARVGVVSLNIGRLDPETVAAALERQAAIACRAGLHCAYLAHQSQGTEQTGTLRLSIGATSEESDIDTALAAIRELAKGSGT